MSRREWLLNPKLMRSTCVLSPHLHTSIFSAILTNDISDLEIISLNGSLISTFRYRVGPEKMVRRLIDSSGVEEPRYKSMMAGKSGGDDEEEEEEESMIDGDTLQLIDTKQVSIA